MIKITDKNNCCGCSACASICPKHCITMQSDNEGFLYPTVNIDKCVDCHLCERVCPCINSEQLQNPIECFGAKNNDDSIRRQSSSGGIFTAIAEGVICKGGVVFGASFDNEWKVVHTYTETTDGIAAFRGSKYVQSYIGDSFKQVEVFLKAGREVLFSGTPCQVAGLKRFLRKDYENLWTIEVVCHGVPSPKIWREYLSTLELKNIGSISHKDKTTGWRGYSFTIKDVNQKIVFTEKANDNKYMMAFLRNLTLRPSCFSCPAKAGRSHADFTLADYWGIEHLFPELDDNKGTSFICVNTPKGLDLINDLNIQKIRTDYQKTVPYNSCIVKSTIEPIGRKQFWKEYEEHGIDVLFSLKKKSIIKRIIKRIFR